MDKMCKDGLSVRLNYESVNIGRVRFFEIHLVGLDDIVAITEQLIIKATVLNSCS